MIRCEHCGRVTVATERGWRASHAVTRDNQLEVVVTCPDCGSAIERELDNTG